MDPEGPRYFQCEHGVMGDQPCGKCMREEEQTYERPTREEMFLEICNVIRKRSTCVRGKVGVLIVRENRIVSMGYNGAPPGAPHCLDLGCDVEENNHEAGCQRTIHAEANAIAFAARNGVSTEGATMYSTHSPCHKCSQLIVSSGIEMLVYERSYRAEDLDTLHKAFIRVRQVG